MAGENYLGTGAGVPSGNTGGIVWAVIAAGLFSAAAAMAKIAVNEYHVLQILFFRQLVIFLFSMPSIVRSFPAGLRTSRPGIHAIRLSGAFVALSCGIWAVSVLPLTTATTITFAQVFFVVLFAMIFLKEAVGIHRIGAVIIGFFGVLIAMRPGVGGLVTLAGLIPLASALGAAIAVVSVRKLSQTESTATLLLYQALFVGMLAGVPLFWLWVTPDFTGWLLLFSMGLVATVGQWAGVKALRSGEASVVSNMEYTKLIFATVFGFALFSEIPDLPTIAGACVILASSAYIFHRERLQRPRD